MPPSGYDNKMVNYLRGFLSECCAALKQEAESGKHKNLSEGICFEIKQIKNVLSNESLTKAQHGILELTLSFYEAISKEFINNPKNAETAINNSLTTILNEITAIHIDSVGNLSKRK